jgi:serine/threonine protein kinase
MGEDLHTHVRTMKKLDEHEAVRLFRQLVAAVAHCHAHRIVLRDIKLGKIFFTDASRSTVVFADIQGAQMVPSGADSLLRDQKGSPAYVSPEVLTCQPYDGAAADIWALGVVLFVMVTGTYPFQETRPAALFQKIQQASDAVVFPAHVSKSTCALIRQMLDRDPSHRPTAAALLEDPQLCSFPTQSSVRAEVSTTEGCERPAKVRAVDDDDAHVVPGIASSPCDQSEVCVKTIIQPSQSQLQPQTSVQSQVHSVPAHRRASHDLHIALPSRAARRAPALLSPQLPVLTDMMHAQSAPAQHIKSVSVSPSVSPAPSPPPQLTHENALQLPA